MTPSTKPLEVAVLPCLSYATLAVFLGRNSNSDSTLVKSRFSLRRTGAANRKYSNLFILSPVVAARKCLRPFSFERSSALLQHENSNYVALVCATTKRHTVVCPLVMERVIAYLRVSTRQQQRSGLGIDAQRATIERFAANESLTISAEFVEFESGKGATPWTGARN